MFTFTATTEQRRIFLIGAATVAAIALTITVVRLSTCSSTDKPLSKRQLASLSTPVPFPPSLPPPRDSPLEGFFNGQERHELAKTLRQRAATAANADDFARAAELYTRALAAAPEEDATLYANRAWCYANMLPPRHREVVKPWDAALALDPRDAMAVLRRSIALQELKATGAL